MKENEKILSKLYLLKAMLSKISTIKDDCYGIEKNIDDIYVQKYSPSVSLIADDDDNTEEKNYKADLEIAEANMLQIEKQEEATKSKISKLEADYEERNRPWKSSDRFWGILWGGISSIVIYLLMKWWINMGFSFWVGLLSFPVSLVFLLFGIAGLTIYTPKGHKSDLEGRKADIEKQHEKLTSISEKKRVLQCEILKTKEKIREKQIPTEEIKNTVNDIIKKEYDAFQQSKKVQINELLQRKELLINEADIIYDIIRDKPEIFLDERDWQNLDLIIYELETGRADNMKEALQQADLYIRHDEILDAMETATNAVCSTIKESIGELSRSIEFSLTNLRTDIFEMNQTNRELAGKLVTKFNDLVNAQELSNALLEKANISSNQLVDDVRRMRILRDEEYYRT